MFLPALMLAAAVTAKNLPLDVVAGVHLGESEALATDHIRQFGPVERQVGEGGAVTLTARDATVTVCQGRVVHVDLDIGRNVHDFARFAELFLKAHGPAESPEIWALDYAKSATGEVVVTSDIVRLTWAKAPAFSLAYSETGDVHEVFVALNAANPCDQQRQSMAPRTPEHSR